MRLPQNDENRLRSANKEDKGHHRTQVTEAILNSKSTRQLILSGAGTGKTTIFSKKIKVWMEKDGISADKITVSSFINFIVADLKKELHQDCNVHTLHKLAKIIVHRFLGSGGSFENPITNDFQVALEVDEENIAEDIEWTEDETAGIDVAENLKNYFSSPTTFPAPSFMGRYFSLCTFYDVVSFDDIIMRATQAIITNPDIYLREKIIVDEYQDFNDLEQQFVSKLFEHSQGGIIAGDDDQSIYSTKNANPDGIISIFNHPDWENSNLPFCSRCKSAAIVECSAAICRKQGRKNRLDKSFLPFEDNGEKVRVVTLSQSKSSSAKKNNFLIEAEYIAQQIDPERIRTWHGKYPAYLILGMKNNHLKRVADILKERLGIEVGTKQTDPYKDLDVQTLYSYIQLLKSPNNSLAYRRLLGLSHRQDEKDVVLQALQQGGFANLSTLFVDGIKSQLQELQPIVRGNENTEEKLNKIVQKLDLNATNENLIKFVDSIKDRSDITQLLSKIDDLAIEQKEQERASIAATPIQCLTIWGSKGLKADTVFVLGLEQGYLPKDNRAPTDEEIRLLYVAMTRAVEKLYLLRCKVRYDGVHTPNGMKYRSVFLVWLPTQYVEALPEVTKASLTSSPKEL